MNLIKDGPKLIAIWDEACLRRVESSLFLMFEWISESNQSWFCAPLFPTAAHVCFFLFFFLLWIRSTSRTLDALPVNPLTSALETPGVIVCLMLLRASFPVVLWPSSTLKVVRTESRSSASCRWWILETWWVVVRAMQRKKGRDFSEPD